MEEWNVGTIREKNPKKGLTRAEDLIIELPEGRETSYNKLE